MQPRNDDEKPKPAIGATGKVFDEFDMDPEHVLMSIEKHKRGGEETARVIGDVVVKKFEKAKRPPSKDGDS